MDYREKIDYSSLSCYMDCPRKFLFKYLLHFRGDKNINLVFGSCYHYGLEMVYRELKENRNLSVLDATNISKDAFMKLWAIEGEPHFKDHDRIFPKSPGHAINMYHAFWTRYLKLDLNDKAVLGVETPFAIDLGPNMPAYIGRLDLAWEKVNKSIEIVDHKTAKALYPISLTSYEVSYQTDGYLAAGSMFYDRIPSMTYNIHLCQKSKIDFHRYHINKRRANIDQFLFDLVLTIKDLLHNLNLFSYDLTHCTDRNDCIKSFRRNPGSACTTFMRSCSYKDICMIRNNPLLWYNAPPQGFEVNEWDPDTHEAEIEKKLKGVK